MLLTMISHKHNFITTPQDSFTIPTQLCGSVSCPIMLSLYLLLTCVSLSQLYMGDSMKTD